MRKPNRRPSSGELTELIALRRAKYPDMLMRDFAPKLLGITRLHMTSIERGRRVPSTELVLRWLEVLAPEAKLSMFGDVPILIERVQAMKRLQKISPNSLAA